METNLDDANPEWIGHAFGMALEACALDVWLTPIQMKKCRPGTKISILCRPEQRATLRRLLFTETSSIGIREQQILRTALEREAVEVEIRGHPASVKIARYEGKVVTVAPEHGDLKKVSVATGVPVKVLYGEAVAAATRLLS